MTMKKPAKFIRFTAILLLLILLVAPMQNITWSSRAAGESTVDDLKKQIANQNSVISANAKRKKELSDKISKLTYEKKSALDKKAMYDEFISNIENEITEVEKLISLQEQYIDLREKEIAEKSAEYEKSWQLFLEMIRFTYEEDDVNYVAMLLDSSSFTDFLSRIDIISDMIEYNSSILEETQKSRTELNHASALLEESRKQNEEYRLDIEKSKEEFETKKAEALVIITKIDSNIVSAEQQQKDIEAENGNVLNEILRLQRDLKAREAARAYVGGAWMWPLPIANSRISSGVQQRVSPITGRSEFHNGLDIPAPYGTPIYASNGGIVLIAKWSNSYGNYVVIDHGGGVTSMYCHSSALNVTAGQNVKKGDTIAKVGSTGASTGNHLHFEIRVDGNVKNPLNGYVVQP
ncbi:metalloendopeptidase [Clostridia bacterium]|nr:metalloendopeptidase [Clostridia bacterium]